MYFAQAAHADVKCSMKRDSLSARLVTGQSNSYRKHFPETAALHPLYVDRYGNAWEEAPIESRNAFCASFARELAELKPATSNLQV